MENKAMDRIDKKKRSTLMTFSLLRFLLNNILKHCQLSFACGKRKLLFQRFEVGWLSPKLTAILAWPKQPCNSVTGYITFMPF